MVAAFPNFTVGKPSAAAAAAAYSTNPNFAADYRKIEGDIEDPVRVNKTRRRITASRATYLLIALTITLGVFLAVVIHKSKSTTGGDGDVNGDQNLRLSNSIAAVCGVTRFPEKCAAGLIAYNRTLLRPDLDSLLTASMEIAAVEVAKLAPLPALMASAAGDPMTQAALRDCVGLFEEAERQVKESTAAMGRRKEDMMTWLSAAITNEESCLDGLDEAKWRGVDELRVVVGASVECVSNSLAILNHMDSLLPSFPPIPTTPN